VGEPVHLGQVEAEPDVAFLQTRNVLFGCDMLTVRRGPELGSGD
jgi:hypothetical protein